MCVCVFALPINSGVWLVAFGCISVSVELNNLSNEWCNQLCWVRLQVGTETAKHIGDMRLFEHVVYPPDYPHDISSISHLNPRISDG